MPKFLGFVYRAGEVNYILSRSDAVHDDAFI